MVEDGAEAAVGALGHPPGVDRRLAQSLAEVDLEVLASSGSTSAVAVLDLVLAELGEGRDRGGEGQKQARDNHDGSPSRPPRTARGWRGAARAIRSIGRFHG